MIPADNVQISAEQLENQESWRSSAHPFCTAVVLGVVHAAAWFPQLLCSRVLQSPGAPDTKDPAMQKLP